MASKTFKVSVVTPEGAALEAEATSAVFPANDGEIGILPNHAPLLSLVGIGLLRVTKADGGSERLYVDGGFAQVGDNKLVLLTEQARDLDDLDPAEATRLAAEHGGLTVGEKALQARDEAAERARVQRRLAR
ncbi:MAG: ATP synthase F1 subunit epsilon [Acidobacteriota bacterium]